MKRAVILYRGTEFEKEEMEPAKQAGFICTNSRMDIRAGDLVIGRYSVLPYYLEQARDIKSVGARLINSFAQHQYIADMKNWYEDLSEFTPKTWMRLQDAPREEAPFVLKGATNSKKFLWDELMFAKDWQAAGVIYNRLMNDGLIGEQDIYVRKYVPLKTYLTSFHGLPITKEFRFFVCRGEVVSRGFYWSSHIDEVVAAVGVLPDPTEVPETLVQEVIARIGDQAEFVVVDFAQMATGDWLVVELNDAQMSGLSENAPEVLYPNLMRALRDHVVATE
jgi:hypothetical protein